MKKIFILCFLLTLVVLLPLFFHPATKISDTSDGVLAAWTITKVQQNILQGRSIFEGDTFYPHRNTIIFSDSFVTNAVFSLPLRLFTTEPITLYSFSLIVAMIFTLFFAYLFFYEILLHQNNPNQLLAFTYACVFGLSQIHIRYLSHLHMFALQYVLMSMWALLRFLRTRRRAWLFVAATGCIFQVWQSIFLTYYVIFFACVCLFVPTFCRTLRSEWKSVGWATLFFIICSLPIFLAYARFSDVYHVVRDIREVIHFSLIFPDLWQQFSSPVLYIILLGTFLLIGKHKFSRAGKVWGYLGICSFILSLGPALHWGDKTVKPVVFGHTLHVPLLYTLFYYAAPGFKAFRTPSRFMPLTALMLLGYSIGVFSKNKFILSYLLPLSILLIGVSCVLISPITFFSIPSQDQYPRYVPFLSTRPERVVLKLPIRNWADPQANEDTLQMLYSLESGKILVNGQSGFFPDEWMSFQHDVQQMFPSQEAMKRIQDRGVDILEIDVSVYNTPDVLPFVTPLFESDGVLVALPRKDQ